MSKILLALVLAASFMCIDPSQKLVEASPQESGVQTDLKFHDGPASEPLPATLDPSALQNDRVSYVVYSLAATIKETLYQVPCYCPCHKLQGHQSLLDCFVGRHGVHCPTCQKEAIFCYLKTTKGVKPDQIRGAIARGEAWKIDIFQEAEKLFPKFTPMKQKR